MTLNNLITVCITTYNRKKLLSLSMDSTLKQRYTNSKIKYRFFDDKCNNTKL